MDGGAAWQVGGGVPLLVENMQILKHVATRSDERETLKDTLQETPLLHQKLDICEKTKKEAVLTPPGVIDALCEGRPVYGLCPEAVYVEEALELARRLWRAYLLNFDADC
jgi:hypothetical protein